MKKYIGLFCGCLMLSNTCSALTCKAGTFIFGQDGSRFCKSNNVVSWYAAHAWCAANGGRLATPQKLCGSANPGKKCNNMVGSVGYNAWGFVNLRGNTSPYRVNLVDGTYGQTTLLNRAVRTAAGDKTTYGGIVDMHALCEEIE